MLPSDDSDASLVDRLESLALAPHAFRHREHVRVAFAMLRADGLGVGGARFRRALREFAEHCGAARKFDEALTAAWLERIAARIAATPELTDSAAFLAAHADLLDATAVRR
jgi:hypothetical protein|nr:hypothetical protein [Kofleriaceae bacterium]